VATVHVETAQKMLEAAEAALPADIAVFSAAVADWRAASVEAEKIKKSESAPQLRLVENPDILRTIAKRSTNRPRLVIGFAAETGNIIAQAVQKLENKGCDWIVANDVSEGGVFGRSRNAVHVITRSKVQSWPEMSKEEVADRLVRAASDWLAQQNDNAARIQR
jgi:phosphopantothenoylcysteine decarboxylase/phosphopantothenate--cysteine ligase